ncbi:MAG: capsule assembly Wzi family protein [Spirochaetes bacterium]|nr:capsule assembly Wzi family protein [Spirochaetota bacterium]
MLAKSKRVIILLAAAVLVVSLNAQMHAQTLKHVPHGDPVYRFLDRAYARGWILFLPTTRPFTEQRVHTLLSEVMFEFMTSPEKFLPRDIEELKSHMSRIEGNRFSLFSIGDDNFSADLNIAPNLGFNMALDTPRDTATTLGADLVVDFTLADRLYLGLRADQHLVLETGRNSPHRKFHSPHYADWNMFTFNLSRGTEWWNENQLRSEGDTELSIRMNQLNQMTIDLNLATFSFGKNSLSWGPSQFSNNILSHTSKPYEYFLLDLPFGNRISFTWMTGFLRDRMPLRAEIDGRKLITAHKLEFQITRWLMFSIFEAVVYAPRFELAYLNPFALYYISGITTGDYDNKLGGFGFVFRFAPVVVYWSVYFDDWNFGELFNPRFYNNQLITTLGIRHYDLIPGLTITAEFTYLTHWMYTHPLREDGISRNYTHFGSHLGHVLGPNSYMIYLDFRYDHSLRLTYGLSFWLTQSGFGSINANARDGMGWDIKGIYSGGPRNVNYRFLDFGKREFNLETNIDFTLYAEYRIPHHGVRLFAALSTQFTHNTGGHRDWNRDMDDRRFIDENRGSNWRHFLTLAARWQAF